MDTKARIGLFAGGLVLVGMVAYVMMPRASAPKTDEATASTDTATASNDFAAAAPTTRPASTQPVASADPFAPVATPAHVGTTPAPAPVAVAAVDANDAWARALDTGSTQTHSGGSLAASSSALPAASTLSTPAVGGSVSPSQKTYKVAAGDSPVSISTKVYGSAKYANQIMAANPSANAKHLKIGTELKMPDIAGETPTKVSSASTDHADPLPAAAAAKTSEKTYKVQSGDTLTKISAKLFGKGDLWQKLYAANKSKIGADPTHLRAGMVLQIPDNIQ